MSTSIKEISGRYEKIVTPKFMPEYKESTVYLTRFAGGKENGAMIQITIQSDNIAYIQLTKKQVKELAQALNDSFDYDKYPSE